MAAKYVMQEMQDLHHEGRTLTYPRFQAGPPCTAGELARLAARNTAFTEAEVKGILALVAGAMADVMAEGRSVRIDGIGTFRPALGMRRGKEREQPGAGESRRNAQSIRVRTVHYRPDKALVDGVAAQCRPERVAGQGKRHVSPYTPEERLARALAFIGANGSLSVPAYAALTGLGRTTAGLELRRLAADPASGIAATGAGSHRLYVRRREGQ